MFHSTSSRLPCLQCEWVAAHLLQSWFHLCMCLLQHLLLLSRRTAAMPVYAHLHGATNPHAVEDVMRKIL